jgi:hypothetical protein
MREGPPMYVRTWKDTEMVATDDSSTSESASKEGPQPTSAESASSEPASTQSPAGSSPAGSSVQPQTAAPARPARPTEAAPEDAPKRTRSRRSGSGVSRGQVKGAVDGVRERVAAIVWILTVIAAVILAAGALLIALDANPNNDLVDSVIGWAGDLDGPFNNMFTFDGENAATKEALVNWGLAAVAWLIGGKIASSIIRP